MKAGLLTLLALPLCVAVLPRALATTVTINPSDDGALYTCSTCNTVNNGGYVLVSGYIQGIVIFPTASVTGAVSQATFTVNPYGLPLWDLNVDVYGILETAGNISANDANAGAFLGTMHLPSNLGYGQDAAFDVTTFMAAAQSPYVGFNLRNTSTDVFSSKEYNYGHPSQLLVTFTPAVPPAITSQPASQTVIVGDNVTFTVGATGTAPLGYQWRFNATPLSGKTDATLTLSNVQLTNAGNYSVLVTNSAGSATSSNAVLTVLAQLACVSAPTGMVSWWRAENNTADSADGNTGALFGNSTYGVGKVGQTFVFDGSGDGMTVGNPTNLQIQNLTIEGWVKRASASVVSFDEISGPSGVVFAYGRGGYGLSILASGELSFSKIGITGTQMTVGAVTGTNWHHVALTKSVGTLFYYVDGTQYPGSTSFNPGFTFTTSGAIGTRGDGGGNTFYGSIDELAIFNRALTAAEILAIYNSGSAGKCVTAPQCVPAPSGLVSWWRSETNALDSADGNNGTLVGDTTFAAGKVGQAFSLDGDGDAVRIGNPANLQLQNFTFEGWIKRANASRATSATNFNYGGIFQYGFGGYALYLRDDGRLELAKAGFSSALSTLAVTDMNSHHVAATKSATNVTFYVDGVAEVTAPFDPGFTFTTTLFIGAAGGAGQSASPGFWGLVDEWSVYNRALSASEVQAIYNAGSLGKCVPVPAPSLRIARSGSNITLAWPASATNFNLQAKSGIALPAGYWSNLVLTLTVTNNENVVSLPASNQTQFYRLFRP